MILQCLPPNLLTWVNEATLTTLFLLPLLLWMCLSFQSKSRNGLILNELNLMLSNEGVVNIVDGVSSDLCTKLTRDGVISSRTNDAFQLHGASQLYPWGIALEMTRAKRKWSDKGYAHFCWVLKNECSERDYRRLCRAVIYVRKGYGLRDTMNVS